MRRHSERFQLEVIVSAVDFNPLEAILSAINASGWNTAGKPQTLQSDPTRSRFKMLIVESASPCGMYAIKKQMAIMGSFSRDPADADVHTIHIGDARVKNLPLTTIGERRGFNLQQLSIQNRICELRPANPGKGHKGKIEKSIDAHCA
jgi:hypothetical protein